MDGDKLAILILISGLLGSLLPGFIAKSKGRSFFLWYVYGLLIFPVAVIHSMLLKPNENAAGMRKCPSCSSVIPSDAKICPACRSNLVAGEVSAASVVPMRDVSIPQFNGQRSIASSAYQLYLTKKHGIEKNITLEKFVIGSDVFENLDDALREADHRESVELAATAEQEERTRQLNEQNRRKVEEERLRSAEAAARDHEEQLRREAEQAIVNESRRKKLKFVFVVAAIVGIPALSLMIYKAKIESDRVAVIEAERKNRAELAAKEESDLRAKRKEIAARTDRQLLDMFFSHEVFGLKIGEKNLALLDSRAGLDGMKWEGQFSGYYKHRRYHYVTYTSAIDKIVNNLELSNRFKEISFSYCTSPGLLFNIRDKATYKNLTLNGVYIQFTRLDEARDFDRLVRERDMNSDRALVTHGEGKMMYHGIESGNWEPTVALYRVGKRGYDPCGNKQNPNI